MWPYFNVPLEGHNWWTKVRLNTKTIWCWLKHLTFYTNLNLNYLFFNGWSFLKQISHIFLWQKKYVFFVKQICLTCLLMWHKITNLKRVLNLARWTCGNLKKNRFEEKGKIILTSVSHKRIKIGYHVKWFMVNFSSIFSFNLMLMVAWQSGFDKSRQKYQVHKTVRVVKKGRLKHHGTRYTHPLTLIWWSIIMFGKITKKSHKRGC